jgi:BioD-like phosphotransacetylase family protein
MVPVLITSNRSKAGKVFFIIGLAQNLMQQGYNVGYIKPLGTIPIKKGPDVYDEDAVFIKAALGLSDSRELPATEMPQSGLPCINDGTYRYS